jgi:hypothetical protein
VTDHSQPASTRANPLARIALVLAVASFVGIWGYVLYLSFFVGRADPQDRLSDQEWVRTAEATCAPVSDVVEQLPFANELESPRQRAEVLDDATDRLEVMVRRLRGLVPPRDDADARAVGRWLDDWEEYNRNRRAYADTFRAGEDEPFVVTDRSGYQIDLLVHDFAAVANDMPSCAPPDDVG